MLDPLSMLDTPLRLNSVLYIPHCIIAAEANTSLRGSLSLFLNLNSALSLTRMDEMNAQEAAAYAQDALEKEMFLTPLPEPPSEQSVTPYNIGDGNCLVKNLQRGHTLHHCVEVKATDQMALTCYIEVDGGDYHDMMYIAAIDPSRPAPTGTPLKDHPHAPFSIQVAAPTIVRVCLCPSSRMLVVSHPSEDYKLYSVGLPETTTGRWILAFHRNSGYIRIFECLRTAQTHWRFPTLLKP